MANVFGRLKTTSLETVDSYTVETSSITELSYTSAEAIGVQWGFSNAKQIAEGCIFVLGDTQQLETETLLNPQKSTFTVNSIVPAATVAETTFNVTVYKYVPGYTAQRVFTWSSLDTPDVVCTKWKAVMEPYVTFGGTSSSFGHAILNYDRESGKYFGSFHPDTAWGGNLFTVYYEIYRYTGSDDDSKKRSQSRTAIPALWLGFKVLGGAQSLVMYNKMSIENQPRRYDMKVRPRLGCGLSNDSQVYPDPQTPGSQDPSIQPDPQTPGSQDPSIQPDPQNPGSQDPSIQPDPQTPGSQDPSIQPDP
ncbi:hypothetical protein T492DRAFT_832272 [Pavlovales sp. CCMP2436]|nr:hypothetical protein T492DRAFT_832272 [Pavlovales sp. CCMP2436]